MNAGGGLKYGDADGYDAYMGGWSAALSPLFLNFVGVEGAPCILDLGCGTGHLLAALSDFCPNATQVGIDPSQAFLAKARARPELNKATLLQGVVERLPLEAGRADYTLSMLVLQEFADRPRALAEMRRVTRDGGMVAACQWDFARMPVISALIEAIEQINPTAGRRIWSESPPVFRDETELLEHWHRAGFEHVETGRISVQRTFQAFDDLWLPLLAGSTPSTMTLAALPEAERGVVLVRMREHLAAGLSGSPFEVVAEAMVVRGRVAGHRM